MSKTFCYIITLLLFISACEKESEYSPIPEIEYKSFTIEKEVQNGFENTIGRLTFSFTDGDGDIGNNTNQEIPSDSLSEEAYNTFISRFYKVNNQFLRDTTITYIIPYMEGGVYREHLKGEIEIKLYFLEFKHDTLKLEFYITDRAKHKSNTESTPEIIVTDYF